MKRILSAIGLVSCVLLASGCSKNQPSNSSSEESSSSSSSSSSSLVEELKPTTIHVVGDSTVSSFNDDYFLPRYGYGTQLANYFNEKVTVNNLALSGRSSRSFLLEDNYTELKNSLEPGDYLLIGFGHNDEKGELARYSNPNLKTDDNTRVLGSTTLDSEVSFKYVLNHYYIELAEEKGAIPILCTPIVRLSKSNDYSKSEGHITSDVKVGDVTYEGGNYPQAIRDLALETKTTLIDLTNITKNIYEELKYEEALNFHAVTAGKYNSDKTQKLPNLDTLDATHTNIYGAKRNAYEICKALNTTENSLKKYLKDELVMPVKETDLVYNENYEIPEYAPFDESMKSSIWDVQSEGWYGTAFGDIGSSDCGSFYTINSTADTFTVGNDSGKGKISSSSEGLAMIFKQVAANKNIEFTATVTLTTFTANKQTGFGIMLRDDIYIDQFNKSILSNYCAAGVYYSSDNQIGNSLYARINGKLTPSGNNLEGLKQGDSLELSIKKINSTVIVAINGVEVSYYDFDLVSIDGSYMYVGMYATRNTIATFTNVNFTITGDSVQA